MPPELPEFPVSRETREKIHQYQLLLEKWQKTINLVAPSTISEAEFRHFEDSLQLAGLFASREAKIYDIGSGAGFPGLVLAAALNNKVELIESDQRKCQFLRTVSREADIPVVVHNDRVENVDLSPPDYVTARALASLTQLLEWTEKWWSKSNTMELIFLKGRQAEEEIAEARKTYSFSVDLYKSKTDPDARILRLTSIKRIP